MPDDDGNWKLKSSGRRGGSNPFSGDENTAERDEDGDDVVDDDDGMTMADDKASENDPRHNGKWWKKKKKGKGPRQALSGKQGADFFKFDKSYDDQNNTKLHIE